MRQVWIIEIIENWIIREIKKVGGVCLGNQTVRMSEDSMFVRAFTKCVCRHETSEARVEMHTATLT